MLSRIRGKKDLGDLVSWMMINGCWYDFQGKYASVLLTVQTIRLFYSVGVFLIIFISSYQNGLKNVLCRYFFLVSAGFYVIPQAIAYYKGAEKAKSIVAKIIKIHEKRSEPWQWEVFDRDSHQTWLMVKFYGACALIFVVPYYSIPLAYDVYLVNFTSEGQYRKPFSFPYPLEDINEKRRDLASYALMMASFLWTAYLNSYGLSSLSFQLIVCSYCCTQFRILCRFVSKAEKLKLVNDRHFLTKLIADHQDLISVIGDAQGVIGPALAAQSSIGPILLTVYLYTIMKIKDDMVLVVVNILCFCIMTSVMYVSCSFGESLQTEGGKFFDTLCGLPWDEMTSKTKKDFCIILMQATKPTIITFKGLMPVNMESFQFILNSSYSYLMLLNSMK